MDVKSLLVCNNYGWMILSRKLISSALGWNSGLTNHMTPKVKIHPITIPPITSTKVCPSLSLRNWRFWPILRRSCRFSLISLRYLACIPAWYLTFIASYQNKNDIPNASANNGPPQPVLIPITTQILLEIPLCTDGNPPALQNELRLILFSIAKSISTLKTWMMPHTIMGTRNNGICIVKT